MKCIAYNDGYKYQLKQTHVLSIEIRPATPITTDYIALGVDGSLTLYKGYAWDGPSGPTLDTLNFMRGSLVHDALYQLMRDGHLEREPHRAQADRILRRICLEDGMWSLRAWWVYQAVRLFGDPEADPASKRPLTRAPAGCSP